MQLVVHLRDHLAPQLDGTMCVHGGDVVDDVVLSGFDCRFSRGSVVVVVFHVLSYGILYFEEVLDDVGVFIVEYVELGFVANCL